MCLSCKQIKHPVQMPRWPSDLIPGIQAKFKKFSGEK